MPAAVAKLAPDRKSNTNSRSFARKELLLCLALALLTWSLYRGLFANGFVNYDDDRYVLTNAHVRAGVHWTTIVWAFRSLDEANWHPLTWLSHALDCQLFQLNPAGHHFTSLALHIANVLLLFVLLEKITASTWRSLAVAMLFAVHPINVESVVWIAERKNVLAMLFFLLTLAAYAWYVRRPGLGRYLTVVAAFVLGLMSKPMVITLPFVLLLLDYWPLERMNLSVSAARGDLAAIPGATTPTFPVRPIGWLLLEKMPLLALSAGSATITLAAQKAAGAISSNADKGLLLRLENAMTCYLSYLGKAVWPSRLAILYPYPRAIAAWQAIGSLLFLVAATAAVLYYRERRYLVVGWFWYLGTMVPMIGLVQVGSQAMADRYAYLPFLGLFVMVVWGICDLANALTALKTRRVAAIMLIAASACAVVALAALARTQITYWHDDIRLWSHALAVTQNNYVAENNLGAIQAREGHYDEAVQHFRKASALEPGDSVSQLNLGIYAQQHGDLKQATARYEATLILATDSRIRASAYANLGQIYYEQRDYARAQTNYEAAAKLNQPFPLQLGLIAEKMGDLNQAIRCFAEAAWEEPSDVNLLLLARALKDAGKDEDAQRARERAKLYSKDMRQAQETADRLQAQ